MHLDKEEIPNFDYDLFKELALDAIEAMERMEDSMEEDDFEKLKLYKKEDGYSPESFTPKMIHNILSNVCTSQFRDWYDAGLLEFRMIATIFNLKIHSVFLSFRSGQTIKDGEIEFKLGKKSLYKKYEIMDNQFLFDIDEELHVYVYVKEARHFVLFPNETNSDQQISRQTKVSADLASSAKTITSTISDGFLSVKDWLEIRDFKAMNVEGCFMHSDFEQDFIEDKSDKLLMVQMLDPFTNWLDSKMFGSMNGRNSMSMNPTKWLQAPYIETFIESQVQILVMITFL
jgi:hypothetical protein